MLAPCACCSPRRPGSVTSSRCSRWPARSSPPGHDVLWATGEQVHPVLDERRDLRGRVRTDGVRGRAAARECARTGRSDRPARARGVRLPADVRRGARPADGRRPAADRPGVAARPPRPRARRAASPLVGAVLGVPSLTHAFGGPVPAGTCRGGRRAARRRCGPSTGSRCRRTPAASSAAYLDICPASVRSEPLDHIADVQPLRPVDGAALAPDRAGAAARLRDDGDGPEPRPRLGPLVAALAALPVEVLVAVGQDGDPDLGAQPANVRVEPGSTSPGCSSECAWWSPTAGRGRSSVRWRRACRSCACRRPPTSSATPRAGSRPGRRWR